MIAQGMTVEAAELQDRWQELEENGTRARELAGQLTATQLWWRPRPGRWSVGECLDHLTLADEAYLEVLDEAIAEGRAKRRTADGPTRGSLFGDVLVRGVEPPARLKIPAPGRIRPRRPDPASSDSATAAAGTPAADPLGRFLELRDRLQRRLAAADGLALGRVRVSSPFVPLLTVNLDTALRIVTSHERRHLDQAHEVIESAGFPEAGSTS